ncbi:MAG TPA: phosphatidylserine decarboxylase [Candidatus Omnitrophota bacterium]|nr:phosphatidylserine decarboxylase [Candidatus Omnitrophota bacterium]
MRIPIDARVLPGAAILLALAAVSYLVFRSSWVTAGLLIILALHMAFFRDPQRRIPAGNGFVSPADGEIVEISTVSEDRYLKEKAVKIGIFLSVLNVHVNRAPAGGTVEYIQYEPGKFLNALKKESVNMNESNWIGFREAEDRILVRQIAGTIARRIHCDVKTGESVGRGQKIGIICYGSRTECYIPERIFKPTVCVGEKVKAGENILGERIA